MMEGFEFPREPESFVVGGLLNPGRVSLAHWLRGGCGGSDLD